MEENAINQRYRYLSAKMQKNQNEFAELLGLNRQVIQKIFNDVNYPGYETIYKTLTKLPFLNAQWLITGDGEMSNISEDEVSLLKEKDITYKKSCKNCIDLENRLKREMKYNDLLNETLVRLKEDLNECNRKLEKRKVG